MNNFNYKIFDKKIVIKTKNRLCETSSELVHSDLFKEFLTIAIKQLSERKSRLLIIFKDKTVKSEQINEFIVITCRRCNKDYS